MPFSLHQRTAAVLACFLPFAVSAQAPVIELDNIVVTASRIAQLESEVVGDVSVIDQDTISRAGQSSVADLLSRVPGIQVSSSGGPQTPSSIFIRGNNSAHTLVLVDGVRINSSITNGYNIQAIDPAQIERIEILRGAGSSLYGAEAIGGVINIITKKGQNERPIALSASMGVGRYNTVKSSASASGFINGFDYNLLGTFANSDGFSTLKDKARDEEGYESNSVNAGLGYAFTNQHRIDLRLFSAYTNGDYSVEGYSASEWGPGSPSRPAYSQVRQEVYSIASTNQLTSSWTSTLSASLSEESRIGHSLDLVTARYKQDSNFKTTLRNYAWQNDVQLTAHQHLTGLLEHTNERGKNGTTLKKTRNSNAAALIYGYKRDAHNAQFSLRHDVITSQERQTTGAVAYDYALGQSWLIGASYNTGFKAPALDNLYGFGSNPKLKSEKSKNVEARIAYMHSTGSIKLVAYQNRINNLIDYEPAPILWEEGNYVNVDKAKIKGYTLSFDQRYDNIDLWGSADFTNPRDKKTNARLARRSAQVYSFGAAYNLSQARFGAEYSWHGKRLDTNYEPLVWLDSYSLLNLTAEYEFSKSLTAQVRWDNVFNKDYEYAYGYNTPGSNVFFNLQWRM